MTLFDIVDVPVQAWLGIGAVMGLVFGSFVTALSYRMPRGESVANGRSKCPSCATLLGVKDLVPVLSWAAHGGKCGYCKTPISIRYPAIELLMPLVFVSAVWREQHITNLLVLLAAAVLMVVLCVIDLEFKRMPLPLLGALFGLGMAWRWLGDGDLVQGAMVAAGVSALGLGLAAISRAQWGNPLVGTGDVYALAIGAMALPWLDFLGFAALAGGLGLCFGLFWHATTGQRVFPFAPAVFAALWLSLLFQGTLPNFVG